MGQDIAATFSYGSENARYGASVAWSEEGLLVGAPGERVARLDGEVLEGPYEWVGWSDGRLIQADGTYFWVDRALAYTLDGAIAWGAGPAGLYAATHEGLVRLDDPWVVGQRGIQSIYAGENRVLAVICDPPQSCGAFAFTPEGKALGEIGEAGAEGAILEVDGVAWAGAPDWDHGEAPGRVCSENGNCIQGLPGDHLGRSLAPGFAVGMFNREAMPPRLRVVPFVEGNPVYVLEEGSEYQEVAVSAGPGVLVVGSPYAMYGGLPAGMVTVAEIP